MDAPKTRRTPRAKKLNPNYGRYGRGLAVWKVEQQEPQRQSKAAAGGHARFRNQRAGQARADGTVQFSLHARTQQ